MLQWFYFDQVVGVNWRSTNTADDWTVVKAMKAFPGRRQQWSMVGGFLRNLRRPCELKMKALKNAEVHHDFLASAMKKKLKRFHSEKSQRFKHKKKAFFQERKKVVLDNLTRVSSYPFQSAASRCLKEGSTTKQSHGLRSTMEHNETFQILT